MTIIDSIANFFITPAHAESVVNELSSAAAAGNSSFIPMLIMIILVMYFGLWRPQSKRAKEQKLLLDSLEKGDEVMMISGILGKIVKITDTYIVLAIADGIEIIAQKSVVTTILPKGTIKSVV